MEMLGIQRALSPSFLCELAVFGQDCPAAGLVWLAIKENAESRGGGAHRTKPASHPHNHERDRTGLGHSISVSFWSSGVAFEHSSHLYYYKFFYYVEDARCH